MVQNTGREQFLTKFKSEKIYFPNFQNTIYIFKISKICGLKKWSGKIIILNMARTWLRDWQNLKKYLSFWIQMLLSSNFHWCMVFGHYSQMMLHHCLSQINSQTYVAAIISYGNNLQGAAGELQVDLSCQVEISFVWQFLNDF